MAQSFNCPNCGAPLDYEGTDLTVRCPFCSSSVIVPETLRPSAAPAGPRPASPPVMGLDTLIGQADRLRDVARLIRTGNKIEAIKVYREAFGVGLAEAKDAVEKLEAGLPVVMPGQTGGAAPAGVERQIDRLVHSGTKIEAIKVYREAYRTASLQAAQAAVEKFASSGHLDTPDATVDAVEDAAVSRPGQVDDVVQAGAEIDRVLSKGQKIEAIKIYRQATGLGLKEAKDAIEAYQAGRPLSFAASPARPQSRSTSGAGRLNGWVLGLVFCVAFALVWTVGGSYLWPNTLRIAAPVLCANGYDDAYGVRAGGLTFTCYTKPDRLASPNLYLAWAVLFGFYFLLGAWLFLAVGFVRITGGGWMVIFLLPLATLLMPLIFFATEVAAPSGVDTFWLLFSERVGTRITPSVSETLWSRLTFAYATRILAVGGEGTAPAYFDDPRLVAVDGAGHIYVAEYSNGRVQVFDPAGNFLNQWRAGDQYLSGLAADRNGAVYVAANGRLFRYDGLSGELQGRLGPADASDFQKVAVTPDRQVVAATGQNLLWFDGDGQPTRASDPFHEMLNTDLSVSSLAVDGQGDVYLTGDDLYEVFIFSPAGKLLKRFGSQGDADDQFEHAPSALAVDAGGRIYVDGRYGLRTFDQTGKYLADTGIRDRVWALAFTPQSELVVLDAGDHQFREYRINR